MNPRTKRLLALTAALLVALVTGTLLLNRGGKPHPDSGDAEASGKKKSLSALRPGQKPHQETPAAPAAPVIEPVEVNPLTLLGDQVMLPLSPEQVDETLDRDGRPIDRLIAAQAILGDFSYLREAADKEPGNPAVQFWILANDVLPEDRADWLQKFKESDPNNALANLLAAQEAFRAQDPAAGIAELRAAAEKPFRDYSEGLRSQVGELYTASGQFSPDTVNYASARANAMPHVGYLQELSQRILQQQSELLQAGEDAAAAELGSLGMGMLETLASQRGADTINSRTQVLFMQEQFLQSAADPDGKLAALTAERERVAELGQQVRTLFADGADLDQSQLDGYAFRLHDLGEVAAAEWLIEQAGVATQPPPLGE